MIVIALHWSSGLAKNVLTSPPCNFYSEPNNKKGNLVPYVMRKLVLNEIYRISFYNPVYDLITHSILPFFPPYFHPDIAHSFSGKGICMLSSNSSDEISILFSILYYVATTRTWILILWKHACIALFSYQHNWFLMGGS